MAEYPVGPRQTFDACFESRGVYELTSLGQILGSEGEIIAKEKMFTVVKTFEMAVHRTQTDFETNDYDMQLVFGQVAAYCTVGE